MSECVSLPDFPIPAFPLPELPAIPTIPIPGIGLCCDLAIPVPKVPLPITIPPGVLAGLLPAMNALAKAKKVWQNAKDSIPKCPME